MSPFGLETVVVAQHNLCRLARRGRVSAASLAVAAALAACAVPQPPSGGPEDRTPPKVVVTVPASDSVGVDPHTGIEIGFSEDMAHARLERQVSVEPPITIGSVRWRDRSIVIEAEGGLRRDTTYVVRLKPGYRDLHGATATEPFVFAFSTGASLDTARIVGTVKFGREPSSKAFVRCFRVPREAEFQPEAARPDRESPSARDGTYALLNLPSNDARFVVMAYVDINGNGAFDRDADPYTVVPDTVVLTARVPVVAALGIAVIDPREPGLVRGSVINDTGIDSVAATVALFAVADSSRAVALRTCDAQGAFELRQVRPGDYVLRAFLDLRPDSTCGRYPCAEDSARGCAEPCTRLPGTLVVKPAATVEVPSLRLRRMEEP